MRAYFLLTLTALFWAGNAIAGKLAAGLISPASLTFSRWLLASGLLFLFNREQISRDWAALWQHRRQLFALGTVGLAGFNLALYTALHHTTALNTTIEQSCMPGLVVLGNWLLWKQPATRLQLAGVAVTVAGVALTASQGNPLAVLEVGLNRGDAIMLLGVVCYGGYTLALRRRPSVHPTSLLFALTTSAALVSAAVYAPEVLRHGVSMPSLTVWGLIGYTAIFPSLLSQLFYIHGVARLGGSRAGLFVNFVPIFGALLAVLLLGEELHGYHLSGLALVLAGIAVAERFRPRSEPSEGARSPASTELNPKSGRAQGDV